MSERRLDPESLLFQSFRHSQGEVELQLRIFRYMDLGFGVRPDLHPVGSAVEQYKKYLAGANRTKSASHLDIAKGKDSTHGGAVYKAVKTVRDYYNGPIGKSIRGRQMPKIVTGLALNILNREMALMSQAEPWVSFLNGKPYDRPERLKARVTAGRASFLLYHGRDGRSTGSGEFDQMYRDVWEEVQEYYLDDTRRYHLECIADAEFAILGELCLSAARD